ncbi:MAG: ammonium transporter [Candidatus Cloacimonetes bacterium]|nr:ammonium transporter [Candidatus Cloacimonadota bacterium]
MKSVLLTVLLLIVLSSGYALGVAVETELDEIIQVQKYFRAIHVMVMLLAGFGFLMVFVKKYGRSAITATYLMVSVAIPTYFLTELTGWFAPPEAPINSLILAEFSAASLLICAGAVLGRLKLYQYILLGFLFVPFYALNEWILLSGGFGLIPAGAVADTGGSIVIHAFGAIFGLGLIFSLTSKNEYACEVSSDSTSDRFSLLGSMLLWIFWPSFCAALVAPKDLIPTVINVVLALCGSTLATYFSSVGLRKKVSPEDIANATLAGGVAIGSTCDVTIAPIAFAIGLFAGFLSTLGFAVLKEKVQHMIQKVDTCGVLYLHGLPGLFGGLVALLVVQGLDVKAQLSAIFITIVIALASGLVVGKLVSVTGRIEVPYADEAELEV